MITSSGTLTASPYNPKCRLRQRIPPFMATQWKYKWEEADNLEADNLEADNLEASVSNRTPSNLNFHWGAVIVITSASVSE